MTASGGDGGSTGFATLALSCTFSHGNCTLGEASLNGPSGSASATGSIDIFDNTLALRIALRPSINPPLTLHTALLGGWADPRQYPQLRPALDYRLPTPKPTPKPAAPAP